MELYSKYKEVIKKLGKLEKAYFTTFNMDIEFVEKYILPPLLDAEIAENKFDLEDLNMPLMDEKSDIKFFYDVNELTSLNKSTLVEIYPIKQKGGVFHPKVIYLKGDKATYLLVGSGNLTLSGWGRNIEAFQIVKVDDNENLHNQVLDFFDDVFKLGGLKERKKSRNVHFNSNINFIYSFEEQTKSMFLENLHIKENLQIYSPYFSKDLDELFAKEEFEEVEEINIVPDLIENQKIRLEALPKDERVSFYRFKKKTISEKNEDSTNHSKVWISENKYAIGSYNCTEPALYGLNFEASLVSTYDEKGDFDISKLEEAEDLETTDSEESIEGEKEEEMKFTSLFRCVADYKTQMFELVEIQSIHERERIEIILPSLKESITYEEFENLSSPTKVSIFRALVKNKIFEVYDSSDSLLYRGLIIEKNATLKTRHANSAETLDDIFASFLDAKNPTEGKNLKDRNRDSSCEDEAIYKRKKQQNHINYFSMFTGFKNLNDRYDEIKNDSKKLERFCFTSATSLQVTRDILSSQLEKESLFMYLTIEELNRLIRRVNRKLPQDSKMIQLKNIEIKLSKKDKAFIEVIK